MNYYTYLYLREDGTPYYVGKGIGKRAYDNGGSHNVRVPRVKERILVQDFLSEMDAFIAEQFLISYYGRKDLGIGILRNRTNGGEGASGSIRSDVTRKKISVAQKGRTISEKTRKKLSEIATARRGIFQSEESRKKISIARRGWVCSEDTKRKISAAMKAKWAKVYRAERPVSMTSTEVVDD